MEPRDLKRSSIAVARKYLTLGTVLSLATGFIASIVLHSGAKLSDVSCDSTRSVCVEWWSPTNADVMLNWSELAFPHQHSCYFVALVRDSEGRKLGAIGPVDWCSREGLRQEDVSFHADRVQFGRLGYFNVSEREWVW